jgi:hypothetical protein
MSVHTHVISKRTRWSWYVIRIFTYYKLPGELHACLQKQKSTLFSARILIDYFLRKWLAVMGNQHVAWNVDLIKFTILFRNISSFLQVLNNTIIHILFFVRRHPCYLFNLECFCSERKQRPVRWISRKEIWKIHVRNYMLLFFFLLLNRCIFFFSETDYKSFTSGVLFSI